ncbi:MULTISPECIES: DUF4019 domain-containing protein [unclassified Pseudomonas]|uniref:DUF4019 domain-containing protein n=1 Tax=unclassified Pseudomonas TaxID=196821 RepID=UPI000C8834AD|nr:MULTISPECIES: DUF4019 domain-containing protein [unclassified Pseudomonas]PMX24937.1 hypothetical protein C1Y23_14935 [Pseudomonas sp. GW460-12]PMX36985.1 hypothetical protein C1Y24_04935 [Pseudomonas sp. MPR-R2A4]PMX43381.1 hypothetical protein C1Y26_03805 [Pseudomonas sp. MPR-R2A7]PMX53199.1 hypothetical protein C1Y17_15135 [Pseudomonas sp. MPR-R2A6]PMX93505.1 hypothetical protein C1Y21_03350 [Pseudomonas sp. MPR-R2A3]
MKRSNEAHNYINGQLNINTLLACILGVIFLSAMLVMSTYYPNAEGIQLKIFTTTLALAAGGFGAIIPGGLAIQHKGLWRAGGAMGLVIIVLFFQPEINKKVVRIVEPPQPAGPVALEYLKSIDSFQYVTTWNLLDPESIGYSVDSIESLTSLINTVRRPLGEVKSRAPMRMNSIQSPPGYPIGLYRFLTFRTHFSNDETCREENVVLRATQDITWKVFGYTISPTQIPCQ